MTCPLRRSPRLAAKYPAGPIKKPKRPKIHNTLKKLMEGMQKGGAGAVGTKPILSEVISGDETVQLIQELDCAVKACVEIHLLEKLQADLLQETGRTTKHVKGAIEDLKGQIDQQIKAIKTEQEKRVEELSSRFPDIHNFIDLIFADVETNQKDSRIFQVVEFSSDKIKWFVARYFSERLGYQTVHDLMNRLFSPAQAVEFSLLKHGLEEKLANRLLVLFKSSAVEELCLARPLDCAPGGELARVFTDVAMSGNEYAKREVCSRVNASWQGLFAAGNCSLVKSLEEAKQSVIEQMTSADLSFRYGQDFLGSNYADQFFTGIKVLSSAYRTQELYQLAVSKKPQIHGTKIALDLAFGAGQLGYGIYKTDFLRIYAGGVQLATGIVGGIRRARYR